jgi:chitin disaccharide deacetylase
MTIINEKNEIKMRNYLNNSTSFLKAILPVIIFLSFSYDGFTENRIKEKDVKITNSEKLGFPQGKKVLLLHIDDAGMCKEANIATQIYLENGNLQSTSIMIPCSYSNEMIGWAIKHPDYDFGIHLTLTSEWESYRWGSVADPAKVPGLIDPDGKLWRTVNEVIKHASVEEVETEIRAQITKALAMGFIPSHIDMHMGVLYSSPDFLNVYLKIAKEYNLPANAIDLSDPEIAGNFKKLGYPLNNAVIELLNQYNLPKLDNITGVPSGNSYIEKRTNFFTFLKSLKPGLTEIYFHPSIETDNLKTITHSWQQRVWEAQLFSDPVVIKFFEDNGILSTNWKEIMERFEGKN